METQSELSFYVFYINTFYWPGELFVLEVAMQQLELKSEISSFGGAINVRVELKS